MSDSELSNQVAKDLTSAMNSYSAGNNATIILYKLMNEHPTLQQSFVGNIVFNAIRMMAKKYEEHNFDGRNQMACKICYDLWKALSDTLNKDYGRTHTTNDWIRLPLI